MKQNPAELLKQKLGPRVAVVGDGKSGQSAYRLLKECGGAWQALDLFARHEEILRGEGESAGLIKAYDSLVVSPGIPLSYFWPVAEREGIRLWNEIDVASLFLEDEKIVAITGSAGKSTCTDGLGYVLRSLGASTFVGGNIGRPFCDYVTDFVLREQRASFIVLELSSYHLENLHHFQCHFSAITSLFPNHLERYPSLEEYYVTKFFFLLLSQQSLYLNRQGGDLETYVQRWVGQPEQVWSLWSAHTSTTIRQALKRLGFDANKQIESLRHKLWELLRWVHSADLSQFGTREYRLIGEHNRQNLALIMRLAEALGLPRESVVQVLSQYSGLPHRLEYVGEFGGYHWVNDSKATTIASVNEAIQSLKPCLLYTSDAAD
ncbi:MAG: Mur ligase family protein, partial [Bdellovibrionaceae bacterium]|nr:Mur ligase family protein [Pseudobdellovibrionaceae bacterium]